MSSESFIRSYMAGRALKEQQEQKALEMEDRADRRKLMTLKIKQEELQDKANARRESFENFSLMQGQPGRNPIQAGVEGKLPATADAPVVPLEAQQVPHKPMTIPGAYGSEGVTVQPQTQEEVRALGMQDAIAKMKLERLKNTYDVNVDGQTMSGPLPIVQEQMRQSQANKQREDTQAFQSAEGEKRDKARLQAAGITQGSAERRHRETLDSQERRQQEALAQQAKLAEMRANTQKAIATGKATGLDKPLSGEAAKVFAIATTAPKEINQLKAAFKADYRGALLGILSGTNRELVKLVDQAADKVGRIRSGGAVNKDEEERFKRQIASLADLPFGKEDEAQAALDGYLTEFDSVANSIDPTGERRKKTAAPATPGGGGTPKILSIERIE